MTENRTQGEYFSIAKEKLINIQTALEATTDIQVVRHHVIDYDWPNAAEHQEWIDSAPVAEIVDWMLDTLPEETGDEEATA